MQLENNLKKAAKVLLACVYAFFAVFSNISVNAADTYILSWKDTGYKVRKHYPTEDRFSDTIIQPGIDPIYDFRIDGKKAYCIEPGVAFSNNPAYAHEKIEGTSIFKKLGYSDEQIKKMAYIASLGYGFRGDNSEAMAAATQLLIWKIKKPDGFSEIPEDVKIKMDEINKRLDILSKDVSFSGQRISLEGYGKEYAITLTDTKKVFSEYVNNSIPKGIHFERNGNNLTIWADKSASETGTLKFDAFYLKSQANNTKIAYYQPQNQTLGVFGRADPKTMNVSYKIAVQPSTANVSSSKSGKGKIEVDLKLHKTDKDSSKGIQGIEFEFFRDNVSLGKAKTDKNGKISIPSVIEQEFQSQKYTETYVENWNNLSEAMQEACLKKGYFASKEDAQKEADKKAQADVDTQINAYQNTKHIYKAVELSSGQYYYLDPDVTVSKEMTGGGTVELNKDNQRYTLSIQLEKSDEELQAGQDGLTKEEFEKFLNENKNTGYEPSKHVSKAQGDATLKDAVFGLYAAHDIYNPEDHSTIIYHKGDKVLEVKTDENGYADTSDYVDKQGARGLYLGDMKQNCWYYWKEIKAPRGYEPDDGYYPVTKDMMTQGNKPYAFLMKTQISDKVRTGKFEIGKFMSNGETEVTEPEIGAEFTVVLETYYKAANNDIIKALELAKADGTKKEYAVIKTDQSGTAYSPELAYGKYVIQQTKKGANGQESAILSDPFAFIVDEKDGQTFVYGEDEHGSHIASSEDGSVHFYINNRPFDSYVQLVKKDKETQKTVSLNYTTFRIQMLDDEGNTIKNYDKRMLRTDDEGYISMKVGSTWYSSYTTNADNRISVVNSIMNFFSKDKTYEEDKDYEQGKVKLPVPLPSGKYKITEIEAPKKYAITNETVSFEVESGHVAGEDEDGEPLIEIEVFDLPVKGQISIYKSGEVLTGVKTDKMGNKHFQYEERKLADAVYEIYAREDILDPADGSVLFKKDTLMDTITTDTNGAVSKKLPLGKYYTIEKKAPDGFVVNKEKHNVDLTYENQNTEVVYDTTSYKNERQKVELSVIKKDAETQTPLTGALFGLYAQNDIRDANGDIVVKADELVYQADSDQDGLVRFDVDLPLADYYVKELKAPIGYASSNKIVSYEASYKGQDIPVVEISRDFENKITETEVSKRDITTGEEIAGAFLTVYEKGNRGAVFDTWVSGSDGRNEDGSLKPHLIKGLEVGKKYVLHEESAPYGFAIAQDVEFTIRDTADVQKIVMEDDVVFGKLKWDKTGEIFNQVIVEQNEFGISHTPVWNTSNLLNHEITIYAAEDIVIGNTAYYKADEEIETLESDWDSVESMKLPVGRYYYRETKVGHGYLLDDEKHYFSIKDNQSAELQIINSELKNERPTFELDFSKVLEEARIFPNNEAYKNIVFGIYARENIFNYMGNVAIKSGSMITVTGIDKNGHLLDIPDLPNGTYYIKEMETDKQYVLDDTEYDFEVSYHGENVSKYTIMLGTDGIVKNKLARGEIKVKKSDSLNEKMIMSGVTFKLSDKEDMSNIIASAMTDENSIARFTNLELGTYYLCEDGQMDGYTRNDNIYEVQVIADGDILEIDCANIPTEMLFSKVDITNNKELPGALITVSEKETGRIVDEWVSTDEPHSIRYLVEGKEYVMTEKTAPDHYQLAESITFKAQDGQRIVMKDTPIVEIPKTGGTSNTVVYAVLTLVATASILTGYKLNRRKRNNETNIE